MDIKYSDRTLSGCQRALYHLRLSSAVRIGIGVVDFDDSAAFTQAPSLCAVAESPIRIPFSSYTSTVKTWFRTRTVIRWAAGFEFEAL